MRARGISFVEKDIEKDQNAREEMNRKLAAQGNKRRGVPVIEIGSALMVGFSPSSFEQRLKANH